VALFVTMVLLGWALVIRLLRGSRGEETAAPATRQSWRVPLTLGAAWLVAIVAYYGLYISPVIASASALLSPRPGAATVRWAGGFGELLSWTTDYVVTLLPYVLALFGLLLLFQARDALQATDRSQAIWLVAIWLGIIPLFLLVNYKVDMIGKHLFFTIVPVAAAGGVMLVMLGQLLRRGSWARALLALALLTVAWQGLAFWFERLVRAST
jgi:hypothetical protein